MREDLLNEVLTEYEAQRVQNEREESERREKIRLEYPEIEKKVREREELVFGTIQKILDREAKAEDLTGKMKELNISIVKMLTECGLPEDYLEPVYRCRKCRDTGFTGDLLREPCECLKKAYQNMLRNQIGLGRNENETFEKFDADLIPDEPVEGIKRTQRELSVIAKNQCEKWADEFPDVKYRDILLTGGTGLGKTFLMRAMAERLIERGKNVLLVSAYTFLQMARKSYFEAENGVRELMEVPVLMLDDLGSEPLMQNITIEQLFYLINERQIKGLSTVISTNLQLQQLRERYSERVASRLNNPAKCLILRLAGRDLRKLER